MPSKVSTSKPLTDAQARSEAGGYATIIMSLAGRCRHLWELFTGTTAVAGEDPVTPKNPQGLIGFDLSGPPWGSAILHPTAWQSGIKPTAADWQAPGDAGQPVVGSFDETSALRIYIPYWCKPYESLPDHETAYERQAVTLRMFNSAASTADITVTCFNEPGDPQALSDTVTVSGTAETTYSPTCYFKPRPGPQMLILELKSDDSSITTTLASYAIGHTVKRTY